MMTVKQVARAAGVSVRTLHHYDAIGLLKPTALSPAGYRLYDEASLARLGSILFFRELEFPLETIRRILDAPDYDPDQALEDQIRLLELRRDHLNKLIDHARKIKQSGGTAMDLTPFRTEELDRYAKEAQEKWGNTPAWQEYADKTAGQSREEGAQNARELMDVFRELGRLRRLSPRDPQVQALIGRLQATITRHYYTCTPQILRGLGQMYAAGGPMTDNIDAAGGPGTAKLAQEAIEHYCK